MADPAATVGERLARGRIVKICGLREPEHAVAAAQVGADLLGFIFAPGRRRVSPGQASRCIAAVRAAGNGAAMPLTVGVFVDASIAEINETIELTGIDLVQLHGGEPPEFAAGLRRPTLKVLKPLPESEQADTMTVAGALLASTRPPIALVIDGFHPQMAGGAGVRADWTMGALLARRFPLMLAGGLSPENVAEAIRTVRPLGVDASSSVERGGIKDPALIAAFVTAAREAMLELAGA